MTSHTYGSAARSQRAVAFATIAGLHALVIAVIVSGFGKVALQIVAGDITARIIEPPPDIIDPLPPPPPTLQRFEVDPGVPPDIRVDIEAPGPTAISVPFVEQPPAPVAVVQPAPLPIRLVGKNRLPNTDDYYPPADIRGNVEGASVVGVCIDANGRRSSDPSVVQSSGSASLDNAATRVVRDGRYARAMQGDQYVPNCYQFRIIFKINQR